MNLYQENVEPYLGTRPDLIFKNSRFDLNNYWRFLDQVKVELEKLTAIPVYLEQIIDKVSVDKKEILIEELGYKYQVLLNKNNKKNAEIVEDLLFRKDVKHLFKTRNRERGEKFSDNRIEIEDRNGDEKVLYFKEDFGAKYTFFLRRDVYQIKKQMEAIARLRDQPLKEHMPLLQLFENPYHQKLVQQDFNEDDLLYEEEDWSILTDNSRDGTSQQREFVRKAMASSDFALLEGPPGSGKTTTIIELIIQLCKEGKRILLVSATHVAVDNVLKRVLTSYEKECQEWIAPVRIARDKKQIRYNEVEKYRLQELVQEKAKDVKEHLLSINNRSESQEELLKSLNRKEYPKFFQEAILESSNLVGGTMIGILQHPLIKNASIDVPFDVMIVDEASKVTFQEFLVPALYAKKWVLVGDVQQLSPYVENDYIEIALNPLLPEEEKEYLADLFPLWKDIQWNFFQQKNKRKKIHILLSDTIDKRRGQRTLEQTVQQLNVYDLDKDFKSAKDILNLNAADVVLAENNSKNRAILENNLYFEANVYGGFLNGEFEIVQAFYKNNFGNRRNENNTWEYELAHHLNQYYAFRSKKELGQHLEKDINFLIPDFEDENGKTLESKVERIKRITMPSILEMLQNGIDKPQMHQYLDRILYDGFPQEAKDLKFVSLSYQHRMEDPIAQISRVHFYKEGQLQTANTVTDRANPLKGYRKNEAEIVWMPNGERQKYDHRKGRKTNANSLEVEDMIEILKDFLEWSKNAKPKEKGEPFEVAVLCFYNDQVREMRTALKKMFKKLTKEKYSPFKTFPFEKVKVVLCTVDKFQGDEADMVLLSFSKASQNAFYKSPNRLNVALTRARYKLILFGNRKFFEDRNVSEALTDLARFKTIYSTKTKNKNG